MGLDLLPDPERSSNASRDHQLRDGTRAQYLYNNDDPEDWGSTASESESFDGTDIHDKELAYDSLETGGLTDREIDRLDGKTSSRLGSIISHSTGAVTGGGTGSNRAPGYPERDTGANTGPKGVIADQKYHHRQQLQERLSFQQAHNARMLARAPTTTTYLQDMERERQEKKEKGLLDEDDGNDTIVVDADEKAILERIRGNRLRDMTWATKTGVAGSAGLASKKVFGSLMEMNAAQYVSAIDTEKKDVTVIIHIYSERNAACKKLDGYLIQLAGRYATTKFIRIKAPEVDFDEEVCPTVLVYRAGDLIANLVMITYELSEDYDDVELEELFTRYKVLSPHDQYRRETSFLEHSLLDSSLNTVSSMSSQFGELNMMSLGLSVGGETTETSFGGSGGRRGILGGNVKEFRYQDYEDDEDEDKEDNRRH
ncbi:hypothetical protein BGZ54_008983 [Gamsiella multidivaricata]|nr:hypothetical protein BGZ54_008983 [Gamsiella multidivaricata]